MDKGWIVIAVCAGCLGPILAEAILAKKIRAPRARAFTMFVVYFLLALLIAGATLEIALMYGQRFEGAILQAWWQVLLMVSMIIPSALAAQWLYRWGCLVREES
jgi:thiol:disulfide interchange protein